MDSKNGKFFCLKLLAVVFAVIPALLPFSVYAKEGWVCSYPGFTNGTPPTITKYHLDGDSLIEGDGTHYHILQNTKYGLVAALSIADIEQDQTAPTIGIITILIDKKHNGFVFGSSSLAGTADSVVRGRCINN